MLNNLQNHNGMGAGMGFSTFDRDNNMNQSNQCAQRFGPWWHFDCSISKFSNPNGKNLGLGITQVFIYTSLECFHRLFFIFF